MKMNTNFLCKSSMPGVTFPAITSPRASAHLAMQFQLEQTQWLEPEEIIKKQLQQLQTLYLYACNHVPFYRQRYQGLPLSRTKEFTLDQWQTIPLLTRDDLQTWGDAMVSKNIPPRHGKPCKISTTGSTGKPVSVWQTDITTFFWRAFTLREHFWHKRNFAGKLAAIRYVENDQANAPHGVKLKGWGPSTDIVLTTGPSCILNIRTSLDQQVAWLLQEQPEYLLTHPSNVLALANCFKNSEKKLHNLMEIRTLSETLTEETKKTCRDVFGVDVTDMYSTREVGYIALLCPEQRNYHVQSENVLVEILHDDGTLCLPGEVGKVVVTSLHNYASPLIRYDIGDYAEVGEPCPCGRGLPVIKKIMGRVRNILTLPDGRRNWPVFNYPELGKVVPYRQIQLLQHTLTDIEVRLVVTEPVTPHQEQRMTTIIREALQYPFAFKFSYLNNIPRVKGGKYEEFISYI
jgi:phenylacetate-CoA ligase